MAKILIVDDERQIIEHLRQLLTTFGYSFDFVTRAEFLFPKLKRDTFDLILLDVNMPHTDGLTLLKQLKTHPVHQAVPVIMLTGMVDDQLLADCLEQGASDFVNKPIKPLVLKARIQSALTIRAYIHDIQQQAVQLKKYHQHLEDLVQARTTQLKQTNEVLQQEIYDRKQIEETLRTALQEKEVLLKEVHHRVKNNLQVISSLLDLQTDCIENEKMQDVFRESQNRIRSMAMIHEQLYQTPDLARIDFVDYVESLTSHLFRSYRTQANQVTLHLDIASIYLSIETAIPCGLIINELVSNALKHAFPDDRGGDISIELQPREAQDLSLVIRDNGVGLPSDMDFRQSRSLGMTLVMTLVKQVSGVMEWDNDNGLEVQIVFSHPSST